MKRSEQEDLLRDVFGSEAIEQLRAETLTGMVTLGRGRRRRRALVSGVAASLTIVMTTFVITRRDPPEPERSAPNTVSTASEVKIIDDAQLLALFPDRSVALIGRPGEQRLLFLDEPPRASGGRGR